MAIGVGQSETVITCGHGGACNPCRMRYGYLVNVWQPSFTQAAISGSRKARRMMRWACTWVLSCLVCGALGWLAGMYVERAQHPPLPTITHVCAELPALPLSAGGFCPPDAPTVGPIVFHQPMRVP